MTKEPMKSDPVAAGRKLLDKAKTAMSKVAAVVKEAAQLDFFARFKPAEDSKTVIDFPIDIGHDTVWATQKQMADLFGVEQPAIAKHIKTIFDNNELELSEATHSKLELVQTEGGREVKREISHYSLDVILTVGYRVSGSRAAEFRKWANGVLRGYIEDGYALNGARLQADPTALQRLTEQVRAIRTSERALYQKVRDTFAACAIDYDPNSSAARTFFAYSQDAFHFAVSEQTAAQIVLARADGAKPNMGMVSLGNRTPTLADAKVAKNYMTAEELRSLELLGEAWLIYAESVTHRGMQVSMSRLLSKVNDLIAVNEYTEFPGYDKVRSSRPAADEHARRELDAYRRALPSH
jgi:hypothetical protein